MGSEEAFTMDLSAIQYYAGADPWWIQFYEYTFWERYTVNLSYYFPTQGLYQQAVTDAVVQDWRGYVDLFATVLPEWNQKGISFSGLVVKGGFVFEGELKNGNFRITIKPGYEDTLELRVSRDVGNIKTVGQKDGPSRFSGNEKVTFVFNDNDPIVISNF